MGKKALEHVLRDKLTPQELMMLSRSFDIVGDIAIIKIPSALGLRKKLIAEAVMTMNNNIKTVLNQISPVEGSLRLRRLEWVAGEDRTMTVYREYGCVFKVDLSKVYFSPRLSFERIRVARLVRDGEAVINMFAGVGCFSIVIAKNSGVGKVYSIDINPEAVKLMEENIAINRVHGRVEAIIGDAKKVLRTRFIETSDRVLMPLPEKAYDYLKAACQALKPEGGFVHYYDFIHSTKGEDAKEKVISKVKKRLLERDFLICSSRIIRTVGPRWSQVVLDIKT